jgi:uncharacterized membrane protein YhhN
MLLMVLHAFSSFNHIAAVYCLYGAVLFVLSDSVLAISQFHTPFPSARFLIMLSYGLAQLVLVNGILKNGV